MCIRDSAISTSIEMNYLLRSKSLPSEIIDSGNISKRLKKADKLGAKFAIMIGEDELKNKNYCLKDLSQGQQENLLLDDLLKKLN